MSNGLDNLDLNALPADVRAVLLAVDAQRINAEERAGKLKKQNEQLSEYNKRLEHLVMEFRKARFGKKSEKLNPDQLDLVFEELETALAEASPRCRWRTCCRSCVSSVSAPCWRTSTSISSMSTFAKQ